MSIKPLLIQQCDARFSPQFKNSVQHDLAPMVAIGDALFACPTQHMACHWRLQAMTLDPVFERSRDAAQAHVFHLHEILHAVDRTLPTQPGLLHATERGNLIRDEPCVYTHHPIL